jgi:hypothetical protein
MNPEYPKIPCCRCGKYPVIDTYGTLWMLIHHHEGEEHFSWLDPDINKVYKKWNELNENWKYVHDVNDFMEKCAQIDLPFPHPCIMCGKFPSHNILIDEFSIENHKQCGILLKNTDLKELFQAWNAINVEKFVFGLKNVNQTEAYQAWKKNMEELDKQLWKESIARVKASPKKSRFNWRRILFFFNISFGRINMEDAIKKLRVILMEKNNAE